jgi:hypothetical protein
MIVQKKGRSLKMVGTPNSVSITISWLGCMKILLSTANKLLPKPKNKSLARNPKNIENIAKITKGKVI